jgi:LacI family transcriptional regulator
MVTIRDVARRAGVSVASASRALNGQPSVTATTREKIEAAARALNYVPHVGARSLTRNKSDAIGVVLPDLFGEFFSEIIRGIDRVAHGHGLQLFLSNMHGSPREASQAVAAMRGRVDGLIVMAPDGKPVVGAKVRVPGPPLVVLSSAGPIKGVSTVGIDNVGGARAMTDHLVSSGYRRIAFVSGPRANPDSQQRLAGFRDALARLTGERSPVVIPGDFTESSGAEAARLLISSGARFDAIFCANDMMAVGCMQTLADAGIVVGRDIGVAGFDDIPIAHYVAPSLTTMNVGVAELGAAAAERLIAIINGEEKPGKTTVLEVRLMRRESTARGDRRGMITRTGKFEEGIVP